MLDPVDEQTTRLVTRLRMRYQWFCPEIAFDLLVESARYRAEGMARHPQRSL